MRYLHDEAKSLDLNNLTFDDWKLVPNPVNIPRQRDGTSCGADLISDQLPVRFATDEGLHCQFDTKKNTDTRTIIQ